MEELVYIEFINEADDDDIISETDRPECSNDEGVSELVDIY